MGSWSEESFCFPLKGPLMRKFPTRKSRAIVFMGFLILLILVGVGSARAILRGGNDFLVFYEAWRLVLSGRGAEIYHVSPDRFLYGPGFAWLLSPLGLLPRVFSLGLWCFLKILCIGALIKLMTQSKGQERSVFALGMSVWGVILVSRPLLIDFEYGQVNLFILWASVWALLEHFRKESGNGRGFLCWSILTFTAIAKLLPLPLLLVPWLATQGVSRHKLRFERLGILFGFFMTFLLPFLSLGWTGSWTLLLNWREAILAKGLPLESHNQSFSAFLYHYLSGNPTSVIAEGREPLLLGHAWLSSNQILYLSLAWAIGSIGALLAWLVAARRHGPFKWVAVTTGLLIVPSHLIWKPYFVMSMPLAILILQYAVSESSWKYWGLVLALFAGINLTGFDFVGHHLGAHFEAASLLLMIHLIMIALVVRHPISVRNSFKQAS